MKVLGIYGSPRKGGNTDQLLDKALEGAEKKGAEVSRLYVRDLEIAGCRECGGCDKTGECVVHDDMQAVYPLLEQAEVILVSSPVFFYGMPSQLKALVDRCQAMWSKKRLNKSPEQRKVFQGGRGYLIAAGATRGKNLFEGIQLEAKYFFDALDMNYEGGIFFRRIEKKTAVKEHPDALQQAFDLGERAAVRNSD